jgi:hypothetical protein
MWFIIIVIAVIILVIVGKVVDGINNEKEKRRDEEKQEKTKQLLQKIKNGDVQALFDLGLHCKEMADLEKGYKPDKYRNLNDSMSWFRKAVDQGVLDAQNEYDASKKKLVDYIESFGDKCKKKGFNGYDVIELCCIELIKCGYGIEYAYIFDDYACIYIKDPNSENGGHINFGPYGPTSSHSMARGYSYAMNHIKGRNKNHIIYLEKSDIIIESFVPQTQEPPKWMMICAMILAPRFTISYPEWVRDYPDARRYVNVAFAVLEG